jgi:hypothetical protein
MMRAGRPVKEPPAMAQFQNVLSQGIVKFNAAIWQR